MSSILYLGVEGVLFPRPSHRIPRYRLENPLQASMPGLLPSIAQIVATLPDISIVLNSWWVVDFGYRHLVQLLPEELASRTIGATTPGNRMHRRGFERQTRVDLLRADIRRRSPDHLTIVDASSGAIPFEYASRAVLVPELRPSLIENVSNEILRLLTSEITPANLTAKSK
ncbi:HAD domain-containing protein [Paraburkholderia terrae]